MRKKEAVHSDTLTFLGEELFKNILIKNLKCTECTKSNKCDYCELRDYKDFCNQSDLSADEKGRTHKKRTPNLIKRQIKSWLEKKGGRKMRN